MSPPCLLIVEDHELVQAVYRRILRDQARYTLTFAANGAATLAVLQQQPAIHLVILDLHLPDLHGREVLRTMRSWGGDFLAIPVVVVSSDTAMVKFDPFLKAPVAALAKPFDVGALNALIEGCLPAPQTMTTAAR